MKNISFTMLMVWIAFQPAFSQIKRLKTITLTGVVKDNATRLPISDVKIKLSSSAKVAKTGSNGRFTCAITVNSNLDFSDTLIVQGNAYWEERIAVKAAKIQDVEILLNAKKQRLIVTSDIGGTDPDDEQSMVHLLVSSNEIDIEGLICGLAWSEGKLGIDVLNSIIDAYGKVVPNLKLHGAGFPSSDYLKSVVKPGQPNAQMSAVGVGKDSPGSELIINAVDKDDPRPIWLNAWGGANTIAQALWKVKNTRKPEEVKKFVHKIRIYDILGQDDCGAWLTKTFPDLIYIRSTGVYGWGPSDAWAKANVQTQGVLGAKYPNRVWATEGDSPAFMHLIPNGLNNPDKIDQGGWGGRFSLNKVSGIRGMDFVKKSGANEERYDPYWMFTNTAEGGLAISRWKQQIWNNLSARMAWSVSNIYNKANHAPMASVNGDFTKQNIIIKAKPNSKVKLDASGSTDPDGDQLLYNWFFYKEPSSYNGILPILNKKFVQTEILIPEHAKGKSIHLILEVSDGGKPSLTAYRRVIIEVD